MALVQSQQDASPTTADCAPSPVSTSTVAMSNQNLPMRKRKQEAGFMNVESFVQEANAEKRLKGADDISTSTAIATSTATATLEAQTQMFSANIAANMATITTRTPTPLTATNTTTSITPTNTDPAAKPSPSNMAKQQRPPMSKAREIRLEQNRKAARESRRRKKIMVEELQRSVVFFSRTNATLKQQNEELERILLQAQSQIQAYESGRSAETTATTAAATTPVSATAAGTSTVVTQEAPKAASSVATSQEATPQGQGQGSTTATGISQDLTKESRDSEAQQAIVTAQTQQAQKLPSMTQETQAHHAAQAAATQAMFETQGFPPAAARAAAQTFVAAPTASVQSVNVPKDSNTGQVGNISTISTVNVKQPNVNVNFANAPTATNIALGPNGQSFPFFVAMAPGMAQGQMQQMQHAQLTNVSMNVNPQQQGAAAATIGGANVGTTTSTTCPQASMQMSNTGKTTDFNPLFALQMHPFLTFGGNVNANGIGVPIVQLAANNMTNNMMAAASNVSQNITPPSTAMSTSNTNEMKG